MLNTIDQWLKGLGLEKYAPVFTEQEIDVGILGDLTDEDLRQLGIPLGPRKKLIKAIAAIPATAAAGGNLDEGGDAGSASVETTDANRRQLTVMFCDMVGSTEMSQRVDAEALREINRAYQDVCTTAIEKFGGYVARYMGDGILAYFGYPHAHEDDAERAVRAGLAVVDEIDLFDSDALANEDVDLAVRVGIATGAVVVGDLIGQGASQENAVVGETPNLAARLQGIAGSNEVIVSPETQQLVGSSIRLEPLGRQVLKGFAKPVEPWRATGAEMGGGRFERAIPRGLGRFVGRTAELERLQHDWTRVMAGKRVVSHVIGEAGIGKSRLVYEFLNELEGSSKLLRGHCASHGSTTAFLPFIDMLRRTFDISHEYDAEALTGHLADGLTSLNLNEQHLPYLLNLLGVSVPAVAEMDTGLIALRSREALVSIIRCHCTLGPVVLFINDCHWIDKSSEVVLDTVARGAHLGGLLTLCTFRPEYVPGWGKAGMASTVCLEPLSLAEAKVLFSDRFGSTYSEELFDELFERSGGNPFFAEELARHILELEFEQHTSSKPADSRRALTVPKTIEGLLLQRVDRLSVDTRHLLQAASVMGRKFRGDLVAQVTGVEALDKALRELVRQDLVLPDPTTQPSGYQFKHALVQDAVYGSLLSSDQKALHRAIAGGLEQYYHGRESEVAEELARHYIMARDGVKAAQWTALAGEKALGLFAIEDAVTWFGHALGFLTTEPESDDNLLGGVLVNQLEAYCWEIDYIGMAELAEQHLPRVESVGDRRHVSRTFAWLGEAYLNCARFTESRSALDRALGIAEELKDPECIGYAMYARIWLHATMPDTEDVEFAERESRRILDIAEQLDDWFLKTATYFALALDLAQRGFIGKAREWTTMSIALGEDTEYSPASVWGLCIRSFVEVCDENQEAAVLDSREAVRLAQSKYDRLMAKMTLGSSLVIQGEADEGMEILEQAKQERVGLSMMGFMYWPDIVYGIGLVSLDQPGDGTEWLRITHQRFLELGNRRAAGLAAVTLGELNLDMAVENNSPVAGETLHYLQEAVQLGQDTAMDGIVARALLGLAALSKAEQKHSEAMSYIERTQTLVAPLGYTALERKISDAVTRQAEYSD
ncbi:AAA family ATPase [Gammaproteobacteria bacterium]|nr:AAA family ATPase [Gammaproteobacteria bacterium]